MIFWNFRIEDYCRKEAIKKIGGEKNWTKLVPANDDERVYSDGSKDARIAIGFREQLKCEHDSNIFKKISL